MREGKTKGLCEAGQHEGDPQEDEGKGDDEASSKTGRKESADDGHGQVANEIPRSQQAQLGVVELETVLHCREHEGCRPCGQSHGSAWSSACP